MWRALSLDGNIWNFIQDFFELFENLKENFLFEVGCRGLDSFGLSHFLIQGKVSQEIEIRLKLTKLQEGFYLHFEILGKFRLWDEWFIRFIISFLSSSFSHFFTSLKIRILYIYIYMCVCVCVKFPLLETWIPILTFHTPQTLIFLEWSSHIGCAVIPICVFKFKII